MYTILSIIASCQSQPCQRPLRPFRNSDISVCGVVRLHDKKKNVKQTIFILNHAKYRFNKTTRLQRPDDLVRAAGVNWMQESWD